MNTGFVNTIEDILSASPVMAVATISRAEDAAPFAAALARGGVRSIEVTLRTPAAMEAIRRIAGEVEGALVGAGTVLTPDQMKAALAAGARFTVSPGATPALLQAGREGSAPYLPAVATASELMAGLEAGYGTFKAFPATVLGGEAWLKAMHGPFAEARFCPTGGVTLESAPRFLALPNVACVGGSWLAPPDRIAAHDWAGIEALARRTVEALTPP